MSITDTITDIVSDRYSQTVFTTLIYCIIVYYCGWLKIFHLDNKKRTTSGFLFLGGLYLNVEHLVYWHRWDIDHFGHEQLGLIMIGLFLVIRAYVVLKKKQLRYLNPFYSEDFAAKYYYQKEKITRHNIEKIRDKLIKEDIPTEQLFKFIDKIEKTVKEREEQPDKNLKFTQQILKKKSKVVEALKNHKEEEFIHSIK